MLERLPQRLRQHRGTRRTAGAEPQEARHPMSRVLGADITYTVFNMKDPVIGGYTPERVALRRAISLATNVDEEIRLPRRGQGVQAQAPFNPHTYGYDPTLVTEIGVLRSAARQGAARHLRLCRSRRRWLARAARRQPSGYSALTQPDEAQRPLDEILKRNFDKIGVRLELKYGKWPEQLKSARAASSCHGGSGSKHSGLIAGRRLQRGYGPAAGGQNLAHFDHPDFNRLYDRIRVTPERPRATRVDSRRNSHLGRLRALQGALSSHLHGHAGIRGVPTTCGIRFRIASGNTSIDQRRGAGG